MRRAVICTLVMVCLLCGCSRTDSIGYYDGIANQTISMPIPMKDAGVDVEHAAIRSNMSAEQLMADIQERSNFFRRKAGQDEIVCDLAQYTENFYLLRLVGLDEAAHQAFFYRSPNEDASGTQTYILTGVTRRMQDRSEWVAFPLHLVSAEHRVKYDLNASLSFGQSYQTDYSIEEFLRFYQNLAVDYSCLPDSSIAVVDENSFIIQGRFTSVQQGVRFTFQPNGNGWEFVMTRCEAG